MMTSPTTPNWLRWAHQIQALAQTGLTYSSDPFDKERYEQLRAVAVEMMAENSDAEQPFVADLFAQEMGYATPKVGTRGAVFREGPAGVEILMVLELSDGLWTLPGGFADVDEPPSLAIEREIFEETGYIVKAKQLYGVYDRATQGHQPPRPFSLYKLNFICELIGGVPKESIETGECRFFTLDNLPPISLDKINHHQIERAFFHYENGNLPADFD